VWNTLRKGSRRPYVIWPGGWCCEKRAGREPGVPPPGPAQPLSRQGSRRLPAADSATSVEGGVEHPAERLQKALCHMAGWVMLRKEGRSRDRRSASRTRAALVAAGLTTASGGRFRDFRGRGCGTTCGKAPEGLMSYGRVGGATKRGQVERPTFCLPDPRSPRHRRVHGVFRRPFPRLPWKGVWNTPRKGCRRPYVIWPGGWCCKKRAGRETDVPPPGSAQPLSWQGSRRLPAAVSATPVEGGVDPPAERLQKALCHMAGREVLQKEGRSDDPEVRPFPDGSCGAERGDLLRPAASQGSISCGRRALRCQWLPRIPGRCRDTSGARRGLRGPAPARGWPGP